MTDDKNSRHTYHLGIRLTVSDAEALNHLAAKSGMSKSLYARKILRTAMKREQKKSGAE